MPLVYEMLQFLNILGDYVDELFTDKEWQKLVDLFKSCEAYVAGTGKSWTSVELQPDILRFAIAFLNKEAFEKAAELFDIVINNADFPIESHEYEFAVEAHRQICDVEWIQKLDSMKNNRKAIDNRDR